MKSIGEICFNNIRLVKELLIRLGTMETLKWVIRVDYECNMMEAQELQRLYSSKWEYD